MNQLLLYFLSQQQRVATQKMHLCENVTYYYFIGSNIRRPPQFSNTWVWGKKENLKIQNTFRLVLLRKCPQDTKRVLEAFSLVKVKLLYHQTPHLCILSRHVLGQINSSFCSPVCFCSKDVRSCFPLVFIYFETHYTSLQKLLHVNSKRHNKLTWRNSLAQQH